MSDQDVERTTPCPDRQHSGSSRDSAARAKRQLHDQTNHLKGWTLYLAVFALNAANGVAFADIMGVSALLPTIAAQMHAKNTIAWASTSQLIAATVGQCLFGYLSDVFSRKKMLLLALGVLMVGTALCGVSSLTNSAPFFFFARGICGVATGSISNLVNIAQNDFLPSERRPKFQGIQGLSVAAGSALGMLGGAALAVTRGNRGWPFLYAIEGVLALGAACFVAFCVPSKVPCRPWTETKAMLKTIDVVEILLGSGIVIPALIALCEGPHLGVRSPMIITFIIWVALSVIAFVVLVQVRCKLRRLDEWRLGAVSRWCRNVRPIIPFDMFLNRTLCAIFSQNILFGAAFYSFVVFTPIYWQVVRDHTPLMSAVLFLPYIGTHAIVSTLSGQIVSALLRRGGRSYSYCFWLGFASWTVAMFLLAYEEGLVGARQNLHFSVIFVFEILVGVGTGLTFQNSVNAIRTQVTPERNAVAVGTRNVLRFLGGAIGTALSSTVMQTALRHELPDGLDHYAKSTFARPDFSTVLPADYKAVDAAYNYAIHSVFLASGIMIALCLCFCVVIEDKGKQPATRRSWRLW